MMVPPLRRRITPTEALYLAIHESFDGADHQFEWSGPGSIGPQELETAVAQACTVTWEARVVYRQGYWVETRPEVAHFSWRKRPPRLGKTIPSIHPIRVHRIESDDFCLVFQIFHGLMDGRGALLWIANVFRALRGEPLVETVPGLTDQGFVPSPNGRLKVGIPFHRVRLSFPTRSQSPLRLHQRYPGSRPHLLPRLVCLLTKSLCTGNGLFLIPVDLRRHRPGVSSAANLTLPIFLGTTPTMPWRTVLGRLLLDLQGRRELDSLPGSRFQGRLPLFVYRTVLKVLAGGQRRAGRYAVTAVVSMLGRVNLEAYTSPSFRPERLVALPLCHPLVAVSVLALEAGGNTEITISSAGIVGPVERSALTEDLRRLWEEGNP